MQSLVILLVFRTLLLKNRGSDAVEVALAVNRDAAAATSGVLLKNADLLERLEDLALDYDSEIARERRMRQFGCCERRNARGRGARREEELGESSATAEGRAWIRKNAPDPEASRW